MQGGCLVQGAFGLQRHAATFGKHRTGTWLHRKSILLKNHYYSMEVLLPHLLEDALACGTGNCHWHDPWFINRGIDGKLDNCLTFPHPRSTNRSIPNPYAAVVSVCFTAIEFEWHWCPYHVRNATEWVLTSVADAAMKDQDKLRLQSGHSFARLVVDRKETSQRARTRLNHFFDMLTGSVWSALTLSGYNSLNSCFSLVANYQPFTFYPPSCFSLYSLFLFTREHILNSYCMKGEIDIMEFS